MDRSKEDRSISERRMAAKSSGNPKNEFSISRQFDIIVMHFGVSW